MNPHSHRTLTGAGLLLLLTSCAGLPSAVRVETSVGEPSGPLYRQAYLAVDDQTFGPDPANPLGSYLRAEPPKVPADPAPPAGMEVLTLKARIRASVPGMTKSLELIGTAESGVRTVTLSAEGPSAGELWNAEVRYPEGAAGRNKPQLLKVLRGDQLLAAADWSPDRTPGPLPADLTSWTAAGETWRAVAVRGPVPAGFAALAAPPTAWPYRLLLDQPDQKFQVVDGQGAVEAELVGGVWTVWGEGDRAEALWRTGPALRLLTWLDRQVIAYRTLWGPETQMSSDRPVKTADYPRP